MRNRLLLLGAALAAFGASLAAGFHFDDYAIFSDPVLTSSTGGMGIWALRRTQPLTNLTFWLNYMVGGRDPLGYHLVSLALHLGAVLLAYECLRRLLPEGAALAAAAVFAIHPLQAEAVNYVWARGALLGALLCLASLLAWLNGRRGLAVAWFAVALLANEQCAAFPLVILLLGRGRACPTPPAKKAPRGVLQWIPVGAMIVLAAAALFRLADVAASAHAGIAPGKYLLAQGPALLRYLRLFVVPYGFTVDPDSQVPAVWLGAMVWAVVLAGAARLWTARRSGWAMWLLSGLLLWLPCLLPAADLYADRRMYLPMFAFAAASGLLLTRVRTPALAAGVAAVLALLSLARTSVWLSDRSLWQEAVRRAPDKARPKIQLSRNLPAAEALDLLQKARNDAPHDPAVPAEMGKILLQERQVDPALIEFGQALALDPNNAEYYNDRGVAMGMLGMTEAARADFQRALVIDPNLIEARQNLEKIPPAP